LELVSAAYHVWLVLWSSAVKLLRTAQTTEREGASLSRFL